MNVNVTEFKYFILAYFWQHISREMVTLVVVEVVKEAVSRDELLNCTDRLCALRTTASSTALQTNASRLLQVLSVRQHFLSTTFATVKLHLKSSFHAFSQHRLVLPSSGLKFGCDCCTELKRCIAMEMHRNKYDLP